MHIYRYGHVNHTILTSKRLFYDELLSDQRFGESPIILTGLPVYAQERENRFDAEEDFFMQAGFSYIFLRLFLGLVDFFCCF